MLIYSSLSPSPPLLCIFLPLLHPPIFSEWVQLLCSSPQLARGAVWEVVTHTTHSLFLSVFLSYTHRNTPQKTNKQTTKPKYCVFPLSVWGCEVQTDWLFWQVSDPSRQHRPDTVWCVCVDWAVGIELISAVGVQERRRGIKRERRWGACLDTAEALRLVCFLLPYLLILNNTSVYFIDMTKNLFIFDILHVVNMIKEIKSPGYTMDTMETFMKPLNLHHYMDVQKKLL